MSAAPLEPGDEKMCGCGFIIVWTGEEFQHDAAPWRWGDDHNPHPVDFIEPGDVELLEPAGVPEFASCEEVNLLDSAGNVVEVRRVKMIDDVAEVIALIDDDWDPGDEWACALNAGFALCNAIDRAGYGYQIPDSLGYRAAAGGFEEPTKEEVEDGRGDWLMFEVNLVADSLGEDAPSVLLAALAVIEARIDAVPEVDRY